MLSAGAANPAEGAPLEASMERVFKLPPVHGEPNYGAYPAPCCWQCNCHFLCCGGCCHETSLPFSVRMLDFVSRNLFWTYGMYYGGNPQPEKLEELMARGKVPAGEDPVNGVRSWDVFVQSSLDANHKIRARIFMPTTAAATAPQVMMYFHGGGWCICHPDTAPFHKLATKIAKGNIIVVSVDYRLAPAYKFPTAVFDCYDVCRWVASRPESEPCFVGVDVANLIMAGDSAGGNLSMVLATLVRDKLGPDLQPIEPGFSIQQLVLLYPCLLMERFVQDTIPSNAPFLPRIMFDFYFDSYLPGNSIEEKRKQVLVERRLSPVLAGFHNLPRTIMVIAGGDPLRFENQITVNLLKEAGVEVVFRTYEKQPHGFASLEEYAPGDQCLKQLLEDVHAIFQ